MSAATATPIAPVVPPGLGIALAPAALAAAAHQPLIVPERLRPGQRAVIYGLDWAAYCEIDASFQGRRVRMTYDRGTMEVMPVSSPHGRYDHLITQLIVILADETDAPFGGFDAFTLNRKDLDRGVLPDQCYYFANEPRVRSKRPIDLAVDPPPDLALEIDITSSSLNRLAVYAAIGVPEVWRYDATKLTCYRRGADGHYAVSEESGVVPGLRPADLMPFVLRCEQEQQRAVLSDFRVWVRAQIARGWARS